MLRILIIEDEEPAAKRLLKMISEIEPGIELLGSITSVSSAISWLQQNDPPDLIFSDIQLADGTSFDIFKEVKPLSPVIFITAYDQYAIEAFKINSIDYLLKPLKKDELQTAITKFKETRPSPAPSFDINKLLQAYNPKNQSYGCKKCGKSGGGKRRKSGKQSAKCRKRRKCGRIGRNI